MTSIIYDVLQICDLCGDIYLTKDAKSNFIVHEWCDACQNLNYKSLLERYNYYKEYNIKLNWFEYLCLNKLEKVAYKKYIIEIKYKKMEDKIYKRRVKYSKYK